MYVKRELGPVEVTLPDGTKLNRSDLPAKSTKRWVCRHKMMVVLAVKHGLLSSKEACKDYALSEEELSSWMNLSERHGAPGLRATALHEYR